MALRRWRSSGSWPLLAASGRLAQRAALCLSRSRSITPRGQGYLLATICALLSSMLGRQLGYLDARQADGQRGVVAVYI